MKLFIDFYRIVLIAIIIANISACAKDNQNDSESNRHEVNDIKGDWILHHYKYEETTFWPPPIQDRIGIAYPKDTYRYKYLSISADSITFSNKVNLSATLPATVLKNTLSGKTYQPTNRWHYDYSGYIDYDTLRLTLRWQMESFVFDGTSGYFTITSDNKYKMVYYLKR